MFEYTTHEDGYIDTEDVTGTALMGYVNCDYSTLVELFGKPENGDGYKIDYHWIVQDLDDGTIATIYNWKNGKNYLGPTGLNADEIKEWHVGGFNHKAVNLIEGILNCI